MIKTAIDQEWGHFQYIIVVQHYAFLDGDADGAGKYSYFYQIFDNAGIDLALSSDTHAYSRSKTLFNDLLPDVEPKAIRSAWISETLTLPEVCPKLAESAYRALIEIEPEVAP